MGANDFDMLESMRAATACPAGRLLQVAGYRVVLRRNARARKPLTKPLKPDLGSPAYENGPVRRHSTQLWTAHPGEHAVACPIHRLSRWFERRSRITRDLIVMGSDHAPDLRGRGMVGAFDKFLAFTHEPESNAIDWLILLFVFLGIGAKIYSVRRTVDLHREVRRRRKAEHGPINLLARMS
jgi:hypothetical protein